MLLTSLTHEAQIDTTSLSFSIPQSKTDQFFEGDRMVTWFLSLIYWESFYACWWHYLPCCFRSPSIPDPCHWSLEADSFECYICHHPMLLQAVLFHGQSIHDLPFADVLLLSILCYSSHKPSLSYTYTPSSSLPSPPLEHHVTAFLVASPCIAWSRGVWESLDSLTSVMLSWGGLLHLDFSGFLSWCHLQGLSNLCWSIHTLYVTLLEIPVTPIISHITRHSQKKPLS